MSFGRVVEFLLCSTVMVGVACTKPNPKFCNADADCKTASSPFCDINGEYPESDYTRHECSPKPANCPVDRCGCAAGTVLSCSAGSATVCGEDGMSSSTFECPLGCATGETRCAAFEPSNGLGPALQDASSEPDVVFPESVQIDTDLGIVQDSSSSATIAVKTVLVAQANGPMIRVLEGKSFVISAAVVTGAYPLAIVSPGTISIRGHFDVSGNSIQPGPGAQDVGAACAGVNSVSTCNTFCFDSGPGGGGNATVGGQGGYMGSEGGQVLTAFSPLLGGCHGGNMMNGATIGKTGGGGGGGLQLVSLTAVSLTGSGVIDLGGGGGQTYAGGGSAGNLIVEAPAFNITGPLAGIAANGGSGGACNMAGVDGTPDWTTAVGPRCGNDSAGDGGTVNSAATNAASCTGTCQRTLEGGGGGAMGRARIVTRDGTYVHDGNPYLSAQIQTDVLTVR